MTDMGVEHSHLPLQKWRLAWTARQFEDGSMPRLVKDHVQTNVPFVLPVSHACVWTTPVLGCICHSAKYTIFMACRPSVRVVVLVLTRSCHWLFSEAHVAHACKMQYQYTSRLYIVCMHASCDICTGLCVWTSFLSVDLCSIQFLLR